MGPESPLVGTLLYVLLVGGFMGLCALGGTRGEPDRASAAGGRLREAAAQRVAGDQEPLAPQASFLPLGARHHHRHLLGDRGSCRSVRGRCRTPLDDIKRLRATEHHRAQRQAPGRVGHPSSKGFVTTYGLTRDDLTQFTTFGDTIELVVPMRVFPTEVRYLERQLPNGRVIATVPDYQTREQTGDGPGAGSWSIPTTRNWRTTACSARRRRTGCSRTRMRSAGRCRCAPQALFPRHRGGEGADADRRHRRQPGGRGLQQGHLRPDPREPATPGSETSSPSEPPGRFPRRRWTSAR